jgi:CBS domain containing-hemolysin-like protein
MLEAAILSLPITRARILHDEKKKNSAHVLAIKEDIHTAVATIVILNNAINIIGSIFVGNMVAGYFGIEWLGIFSAVMTFGIIVLSEIIPKTIGEQHKVSVSFLGARTLRFFMWFFRPFINLIIFLTKPILTGPNRPQITEREIKAMLRIGRTIGTIEVDEETLINRVFKLNDLRASQMMKPIEKIFALEATKTLKEAKDEIMHAPFSRIAVYEKGNIQNIVGTCQLRVLLHEIAGDNYSARIRDYMRKPIFVHENERADNLLEKFRFYNQHLFIVRDRFKKNIGIITMEDVLEELFGEIYDEKDFAHHRRKSDA